MSNAGRPDRKHVNSSDNRDPAKRPKNDPEGSHGSTSDIDWLRDGCGAESESSKPSIEPEFDFAPKIDRAAKHDKPPILARFKHRNRVVQSDLAFLPYEAARLAPSAPSLKQSCFDGKLVPLCLVGIMMTGSVVSAAVVWSVHDDGVVSPTAEVSAADSGASMTSRLDNDLKREVQAPKVDSLAVSTHRTELAKQSFGLSLASDDRKPLPDNSLTSPPVSIQNRAASTSVQKNESEGVNDRTKASLASEGLPATLVAAVSSGSMVNRIESSIAARSPAQMAEDRGANGVVPRQIKPRSDAKTALLENGSLVRPQHKPSFKPLEVAALLLPSVVTTSFRPAFKPRENPPRAGLLASSDAIGNAKHTPMLKRFWGTLVQGVAEAFRNRDTSYQLVMKADSGGGSDGYRGGGHDGGGGNDYAGHDS